MRFRSSLLMAFLLILSPPSFGQEGDLFDEVEHHFAENAGVRIHYVTAGAGPLVVMIHGFPDFWFTWRHQMAALASDYRVAAVDLRGYNRSDQPAGLENYAMPRLVEDIVAVIEDQGRQQATIVGHDWGGMVSWTLAMTRPELVENLIICNLPHPRGLMRELATNPTQQANSQYARDFQKPGAHEALNAEALAGWVAEPEARTRYVDAFERSSFEAMLNYYKANYPREPYLEDTSPLIKVQAPVLLIHGLADQYLLADALGGTWDWLERDLTIVTVPGAGHFVHRDAAEFVTDTIKRWLDGKRK